MEISKLKINFLGDSITEGYGSSAPENCFVNLIDAKYKPVACRNYGIGGTRIAPQKEISENPIFDKDFIGRAKEMDKDADLVCVFGGTNDYGHGLAPFGKWGDSEPTTFCGSIDYLLKYLTEKYAGKQLMVITPLKRADQLGPRFDGKTLEDFVEMIKMTAKKYSIPILDLYKTSGICPENEANAKAYTFDKIHPNDKGYSVLAHKISKFIESL